MAGDDRASIFVGRLPEEVFRYLIELNDAPWRSGVLDMRLSSESYRGVGSTHVEVRRLLAWRVESPAEVVTYEPNRSWAVRRASGPVRPQVTYTIGRTFRKNLQGLKVRLEAARPIG